MNHTPSLTGQWASRDAGTLLHILSDTSALLDLSDCGEYGVIDLADNDSKIRWATDICAVFDKYGIGRAYWNYKEKDYGIVDIPDESVQRELAAKL